MNFLPFQALSIEKLGKCSHFKAVSGLGLRCEVSEIMPLDLKTAKYSNEISVVVESFSSNSDPKFVETSNGKTKDFLFVVYTCPPSSIFKKVKDT